MSELQEIRLGEFVQEVGNKRYIGKFVDPDKVLDPTEVNRKLEDLKQQIANNQVWKKSVPTFADIATTYLSPQEGWTVSVDDTNTIYRNGLIYSKIRIHWQPKHLQG